MTMLGIGAFLVVTGLMTMAVVLACAWGLVLMWRSRGAASRLARAEGWRHAGGGRFEGRVGESDWRGGAQEDSDSGDGWTEFDSGGADLFHGGLAIRSHAAWQRLAARQDGPLAPVRRLVGRLDSAIHRVGAGLLDDTPSRGLDDPDGWQPCALPQVDAAWSARWELRASEPHWAAVLTPEVVALWLRAAGLHGGELKAQVHRRRLWLHRDDGPAPPSPEQVAALLRLGQALLAASLAVAVARRAEAPPVSA